ncbi:unnamed protein product [Boreogadus saida]
MGRDINHQTGVFPGQPCVAEPRWEEVETAQRSCFILPAPNPGLSRCFALPEIEEGTIITVCICWGCLQELWCRRTTCGLEHMVRDEWAYCKCFKMVRKRKVFYKGTTLANPPRIRRLMLVLTEEGRGREQHTGRGLGGLWMEDRRPPTASGQEDVSWAKGEDILRSRTPIEASPVEQDVVYSLSSAFAVEFLSRKSTEPDSCLSPVQSHA